MSAHALLAPSSAHIWAGDGSPGAGCPASVNLQRQFPDDEESQEAREGTAAHYYATGTLEGRQLGVGSIAPNGEPITQEMVDAAQDFIRDVRDTMTANPARKLFIEQRLYMPAVHGDNWGTQDVFIRDDGAKILFSNEFKYGHRYVEVAGNLQLADYSLGALNDVPYDDWPNWTVIFTVFQPRSYHPLGPVREWKTTGAKLRDEYLPALRAAAERATAPNPEYQTGKYCRDCTARHVCPALQEVTQYAIDVSRQAAPPVQLSAHALGLELRQVQDAMDRLKARATGLEQQALGSLKSGQRVPFFKAGHTKSRERWKVPAVEAFALGDMLGVDLRKPPEPITPNQARKAGIDEAVIALYSEQPSGALKIERADDNEAKLAFE